MAVRPIPDPGVLKQADAFRQASQMLNMCPESAMSIPAVVNAAFALELYLKSLNMEWHTAEPSTLGGKKAWLASRTALQTGHKPSKLYKALDQALKDALEKKYRERFVEASDTPLEKTLKSYDGLFQDWRYIFEGHASTVELQRLFSVLQFFSEELNALPQKWA
jgi:hypothetical protein